MENDRLDGSDDGHTHSFRFFMQWPNKRPATSISINYESLTRRYEDARVDLVGIDAAFQYPLWTGGRFAFSGGVAVNGDLGGQSLQNALHGWLNESKLHLAYPDSYAFGLASGAHLDQDLASWSRFRLTASGDVKVASNAAPSWAQGSIYLSRDLARNGPIKFNLQFGVSVYDFFWLDEVLRPYYGRGYNLDSRIRLEWQRLMLNMFYYSDPYGINQSIIGVGIGCFF